MEPIGFRCSGTDRKLTEYASCVGCFQFVTLSQCIEDYGSTLISNLRSTVFLAGSSDGLGFASPSERRPKQCNETTSLCSLRGVGLLGVLRFYSDRFLDAAFSVEIPC